MVSVSGFTVTAAPAVLNPPVEKDRKAGSAEELMAREMPSAFRPRAKSSGKQRNSIRSGKPIEGTAPAGASEPAASARKSGGPASMSVGMPAPFGAAFASTAVSRQV